MEHFFRPVAMGVEVILLLGVVASLILGIKWTSVDLGVGEKYQKFIDRVLMILVCLALVFLIAHLVTFYPRSIAADPGFRHRVHPECRFDTLVRDIQGISHPNHPGI